MKRHVHFSVEIHELDTTGQWTPVEVDAQEQILSGGLYQLKQVNIINKKTFDSMSCYLIIRVKQNVLSHNYVYFLVQIPCHYQFVQYDRWKLVQ